MATSSKTYVFLAIQSHLQKHILKLHWQNYNKTNTHRIFSSKIENSKELETAKYILTKYQMIFSYHTICSNISIIVSKICRIKYTGDMFMSSGTKRFENNLNKPIYCQITVSTSFSP
jgi:hypothetical protein